MGYVKTVKKEKEKIFLQHRDEVVTMAAKKSLLLIYCDDIQRIMIFSLLNSKAECFC